MCPIRPRFYRRYCDQQYKIDSNFPLGNQNQLFLSSGNDSSRLRKEMVVSRKNINTILKNISNYKEWSGRVGRLPKGHTAIAVTSSKLVALLGETNTIDLCEDT